MVARTSAGRRSTGTGGTAFLSGATHRECDANRDEPDDFTEELDRTIRASLASQRLQEADRQDCAQETWLAILEGRPSGFRGGDLKAWAATIARNKAMDLFRRTSRRPTQVLQEDIQDGSGDKKDVDDLSWRIWCALADLEPLVHPRRFLVFFLRSFEGWSFREIEDNLGLTAEQARLQNHRVLRKFRSLLESGMAPSRAPVAGFENPGSA